MGGHWGAHEDWDPQTGVGTSGYTGSGEHSGNNNTQNNDNLGDEIDALMKEAELERIINSDLDKNQVDSETSWGKKTGKFNDIRDKYLKFGFNALTEGEKSIAKQYIGSVPTQYGGAMERFKNSPGGLEAYKKRFPNPLTKIAQGIGNYITGGGIFGLAANALGGFTDNASTMIKDFGNALGLDSLKTKLLGLASGSDSVEVADFIKGATNPAYDPSGLEGYKDAIFKDLYAQMPNIDVSMEDEYSNFQPDSDINPYPVGSVTQKQIELMKDKYMSDNTEDVVDEEKTLIDLGLMGGQPLSSVTENVSETNYDTSGLKNQIMNNPGTTTFGAVPGQNFNVFDPDAYLQENPITEDMIETGIIGQANGGYMSSFPNQNLNTESLSASDNIDDRIMKNLEFEKMAPGMMGYAGGGKPMTTYQKLKAIADSHYG